MYFKSYISPVKVVGIVCQLYFFLFSSLSIIILLKVTIPSLRSLKLMKNDTEQSEHIIFSSGLEILSVFLLCLTVINYTFLKYNAALSSFRYEESKATPIESSTNKRKPRLGIDHTLDIKSTQDVQDRISDEQDTFSINFYSVYSNSFLYSSNNKDKAFNKNCKEAKTELSDHSNLELDIMCSNSMELNPEANVIKDFPDVTAKWYFCRHCKQIVPPRAKHCPLCNVCVLKRDHHCFFADCCIGFHNQRYFITFCFYASLSTLFSTIITSFYLEQHFTPFQTLGYVSYLPPVIVYFWFLNIISNFILALLIFQYFSIITTLCCIYYFITQVYLVCSGQTMYEHLKGIHTFKGPLWENVYSVFGRYWFISFFIPVSCHGFVSDGINWDSFRNNKCL